MCGRYCLYDDGNEELRAIFDRTEGNFKMGEVFPTDKAPVLIQQSGSVKPQAVVWGFPGFQGKGVIINARAETVMEKPMFRNSIQAKRCVIPSSGFFEWSHDGKKTKYQFNLPGSSVLYMAGLYQDYEDGRRFVILTEPANESMAAVHSRMPLVIPNNSLSVWLGSIGSAANLLQAPGPELVKKGCLMSPPDCGIYISAMAQSLNFSGSVLFYTI